MGIKYKVNSGFFDKWSSKMAYLLGFIYADGSIYQSSRGSYVNLTSIDKIVIKKTRKWLDSGHKINIQKSNWPNGKDRFVIRIGDKKIYNSLKKLGLYPSKSLTVRLPRVPKKFLKDFIRGYFDGDGCVFLYRSAGLKKKIILRKLSIIFTSGSKNFLDDLLKILKENINLKQDKIYKSQRSFQLRFSTTDTVNLFKFLYKKTNKELFLKRKFVIFINYFKLNNKRIDNGVKSILQYYNGHVVK